MSQTTIKCPNCQTEINVNEILYHQFEEKLKEETQKKDREFQKSLNELKAKEESIAEQREKFDEELKKATKEQVKKEKSKLRSNLKKELQDEQSESMALLEKELREKSKQVKELNKNRAEIEKLKRERYELEDKIKADSQKILNEKLQEEKQKIEQRLKEESERKDRASDEAIDRIKRELERSKKAEQEMKKKTLLEQKRFEEEQKRVAKEQLKAEKERLRRELEDEQSESKAVLERELAQKSEQIKELNRTKAEIDKLKRERVEVEDRIKIEAKRELDQKLEEERKRLNLEQVKVQEELKQKILKEQNESISSLQEELESKSEQIKELNNSKIEIAKLKREREEVEAKIKAEAQISLDERLYEEKLKIQKSLEIENELKLRAKDESLEQIKKELENARRKAEQGSMQIQGEALELAIESWLGSQFPFDNIKEVKKGAFGADCVQTINTRDIANCGIICYESKNTKSWSDGWISKLKQDMLKVNADLGVLVTSVYPKDMRRMGFVDDIWVCSLDEFKGSSALLRDSLIRVYQTAKKDENRTDKISRLYDYMTGNEFSMQLTAIVDGFIKMQEELDKEKRSLMASWKRRQKTIDGVLTNTTEMYGALQGIAGASVITNIEALELSES
jgi:hypothetical protein